MMLTACCASKPRLAVAEASTGLVMREAKSEVRSLITVRRLPSSSTLASSMFSMTLGRRPPPIIRQRLLGSKRPPRSRSSQKVLVTLEKSKETSGVTYSMSNATICCLRIRRCLMRKRRPSTAELLGRCVMRVAACWSESVVWWTILCARSSKTVDWEAWSVEISFGDGN